MRNSKSQKTIKNLNEFKELLESKLSKSEQLKELIKIRFILIF